MIFIWIPKTGGTTFTSWMHPEMKVYTQPPYCFDLVYTAEMSFGHACPKELLRNNVIPKSVWDSHVKVAIVRNPYDRFVSLYHDFKRTGRIDNRLTQMQFARAILEMNPKPGFFNSDGLSQCALQVDWLLPGVRTNRFEETVGRAKVHLNKGDYSDKISNDAIPHVNEFYRADFVTLNYEMKN